MLIDKSFDLAVGQDVTASAATTNVIDLKKSGKFAANPFFICGRVKTAATASGAATVTFSLETCDAENFSSGVVTIFSTAAIAKTALTANSHVFKVNIGEMNLKRYLRGYYTVATGPLTAGAFDVYGAAAADLK